MAKKKKKQKLDFSANSQSSSGFGRTLGTNLSGVAVKTSPALKKTDSQNSNDLEVLIAKEEHVLSPLGPKRVLKLAISKKGRGGKTVTTLQVLAHSTELARERLAKALGKALGCRVWHEDGLLCLQGEQRERVEKWIKQQD